MAIEIKNPKYKYMKGDRQQNSHVLANEVLDNLIRHKKIGSIDIDLITNILKKLLVFHYSFLGYEDLHKQMEQMELYKVGKADTPITVKW